MQTLNYYTNARKINLSNSKKEKAARKAELNKFGVRLPYFRSLFSFSLKLCIYKKYCLTTEQYIL